ncbi:hypothetical protein KUTeg_007349 [Tegillarca granosa]|uniref:Uncharacterized protein n=1 Tax=Tegillarca granosa TaxID=220873 RepID=A0ABQ9FD15_TEGGR|nr:hypothetical protein KUTeg_007349 [Tegillarca granosa]
METVSNEVTIISYLSCFLKCYEFTIKKPVISYNHLTDANIPPQRKKNHKNLKKKKKKKKRKKERKKN